MDGIHNVGSTLQSSSQSQESGSYSAPELGIHGMII